MFHTFSLLGFTAALGLASACVTIENPDESGGDDNADETGNNDGNNDSSNNDSNNDSNDDGNDDSADICEDACGVLESCGFPTAECLDFCVSGACAECLAASDQCGEDCVNACSEPPGDGDGDDDPTGDGDGEESGDGDGDVPPKECVINNDCGISFECVSCELNDAEGWCEQTMECDFDEDCGFGGKCGYNVETAAWRCLPAEYCQ